MLRAAHITRQTDRPDRRYRRARPGKELCGVFAVIELGGRRRDRDGQRGALMCVEAWHGDDGATGATTIGTGVDPKQMAGMAINEPDLVLGSGGTSPPALGSTSGIAMNSPSPWPLPAARSWASSSPPPPGLPFCSSFFSCWAPWPWRASTPAPPCRAPPLPPASGGRSHCGRGRSAEACSTRTLAGLQPPCSGTAARRRRSSRHRSTTSSSPIFFF